LAHSFFNKEEKININFTELDNNIIWLWKILNEINIKISESQYYYDWFKENIQEDYNILFEDLKFASKIKDYFSTVKKDNPNDYFIEECRKYCNLKTNS
jgi:hypothetical protein